MSTREMLLEPSRMIWDRIFSQPFVIELGSGTLPREKFIFFMQQDYAYLLDFAKVLCLAGAKAEDVDTLKMLIQHAIGGIEAERTFHRSAAAQLGVPLEDLESADRAPVTRAYTRHLLTVGREGTLGEIVAALLPCYWIYGEVGRRLAKDLPENDLYRSWIEAYASEDYWLLVEEQLSLVDRLGPRASEDEMNRMIEHFRISSKYEFYFWDQAYHRVDWTV